MNSGNGTNHTNQPDDEKADFAKIEQLLTESLDKRVDSIDAVTSAKLSAARHRALESDSEPRNFGNLSLWKGGLAALSVCILAVSLWPNNTEVVQQATIIASEQSSLLADLEILASTDSVEFYESLDFLIWLENAPENSG